MRRYPYSRMHARRWCRVCDMIRNVRLKWSRDMHVCLSCGACTSGMQEHAQKDEYVAKILSYGNIIRDRNGRTYADFKVLT